mgnify:CR=1 FL=1
MYRLMQPSDEAAVVALWQKERGDSAEFIKTALEKFAGAENIYVAEENDEIVAAALAVPVTLKGRSGSYLYGLCGQGSLILAGLVDYLCAQQKLRGAGFTVAVPAGQEQAALLENKGFQRAFALRCLPREVSRNLWSQAEFDSVTARKLCELRERFYPDTVQFPPEQMAVVLTDLYARGATIVSNEKGYGIYFRREDTLYFVELMAEDDRSAEVLMEAAREKEVIVERAVITVGAAQNLFLGEGTRQDYGMIRFDAEPFDVEERLYAADDGKLNGMVKECVHGTDANTKKSSKRRRSAKLLLMVLLILVLAAGGCLLAIRKRINGSASAGEPVSVSIQQGSGVAAIAQKLKTAGVIKYPTSSAGMQASRARQASSNTASSTSPRQLLRRHHRGAFRLREGRQCPADLPRGYDGHRHCEKNWRMPGCAAPKTSSRRPTPAISASTGSGSTSPTTRMPRTASSSARVIFSRIPTIS